MSENQSYTEKYNVEPNQNVYVVGKLKFASLVKKDKDLKYPVYDVKIVNPEFYNEDGTQTGNFIDAIKDGYIFKTKNGDTLVSLTYKDSPKKPYLDIIGHEEAETKPANEVLIDENGQSGYLTPGQTVQACVHSFQYNYNGKFGVSQSLKSLEIASFANADITWLKPKQSAPKKQSFNPFN